MRRLHLAAPLTAVLWAACSQGGTSLPDAGERRDATTQDATSDGGGSDSGPAEDAMTPADAGQPDASAQDAGHRDASAGDGGGSGPILERNPRISKTCSVAHPLVDLAPRYFSGKSALHSTGSRYFSARAEHSGSPFGGGSVSFLLSEVAFDASFGAATDLGGGADSSSPVMAGDANGFALVWVQSEHLRFARFDATGAQSGATRGLTTPAVGQIAVPRMIALSAGGFLLAYSTSAAPTEVQLLFLNADGTVRSGPTRFLSSFDFYDHGLSLVETDTGFAAVYRNKASEASPTSAVYLQRLDASGHATGGATLLSTTQGPDETAGGGPQFGAPRTALVRVGDQYVAAWPESSMRNTGGDTVGWSRIVLQRFDLTLTALGGPTLLAREVDHVNADEPALYAKDGKLALLWTQGTEIYICAGCFPDNALHFVWLDPSDLTPISAHLTVPPIAGGFTDEQGVFVGDDLLVAADLRFHVHTEPGFVGLRCR